MRLWDRFIHQFKDILFPIFCLECQLEGYWWCENCIKKNVNVGIFCCPVCHILNTNGQPCNKCKAASPLNGNAAFLDYNEEAIIGQLIKRYKYNFAFDIAVTWEKMIDIFLPEIFSQMNIDVDTFTIIPIPLHISRERERGFNQADLVAQFVFKKLLTLKRVEYNNKNFIRQKKTNQQAKLNRVDRFDNLKEAFVWVGQKSIPKNILLIDDVYTSGATMQECARMLKKVGAQKVYGFTLARG